MGACRESFNLFSKYRSRVVFREFVKNPVWLFRQSYFWEDTFCPFICLILGHDKYKPEENEPDMACRRCHKFVK